MDVNLNVQYKASEINGMYNDVESMKNQRAKLKESIDIKTQKIIDHITQNGNVLAYKNDVPHVLSVRGKVTTKMDKGKLANDAGVSQSEINLIGVAELVEDRKVTSDQIKACQYQESDRVLAARKAKKSDIVFLGSRAL